MRNINKLLCLILFTLITLQLSAQNKATDIDIANTLSFIGAFDNILDPTVADDQVGGISIYSGHICDPSLGLNGTQTDCSNPTGPYLASAIIGTAIASTQPAVDFARIYQNSAESLLYQGAGGDDALAAFRYKDVLYSYDSGSGTPSVQEMTDLWGPVEVARMRLAETTLRSALKYAPEDRNLRNALLDLYYDWAQAELSLAEELLATRAYVRFLDPAATPAVNREIDLLTGVRTAYINAINGYFELLRDPLGVSQDGTVLPSLGNEPFGYYIFRHEVPTRSKFSPTYVDDNQVEHFVFRDTNGAEQAEIFSGYKDLVLLFEALADIGETTDELIKLHLMRGQGERDADCLIVTANDFCDAANLITQTQQQLWLDGSLLLGIFPDGDLPSGETDLTGLRQSIARWQGATQRVASSRAILEGNANILGFEDDFLFLVSEGNTAGRQSFNLILDYLGYLQNGWTGLMADLQQLQSDADTAYTNFQYNQDQVVSQYQDRVVQYDNRLFQIVGARRCDLNGENCAICPGAGAYCTPDVNPGSEINLLLNSIDQAANRVTSQGTRMENLHEQIQIEVERRGREAGINDAMGQVYIDFGNRQAQLSKDIAKQQAIAAAASAQASSASALRSGIFGAIGFLAGQFNSGVQYATQIEVGRLQAQKDRLNGQLSAEITSLNDQLLDNNSKAKIKTLWLEASIISLDMEMAQLSMQAEINRLSQLYNEKNDLERRMDSEGGRLAERWFADPSHRLRMHNELIELADRFERARTFAFYAAKALLYKHNINLEISQGQLWDYTEIFRLRDVEELEAYITNMAQLDFLQERTQAQFDIVSIRRDVFNVGNDVLAYRERLRELLDPATGYVELSFSTVRDNGFTLFVGPRETPGGTSPGDYNDKIASIQLSISGPHGTVAHDFISGDLWYGESSYIRNQKKGCPDVTEPSHIIGEMTSYSAKYWFFDNSTQQFNAQDRFKANGVRIELFENEDVPPEAEQITKFSELSVATPDWRLFLPTIDAILPGFDIDQSTDILLKIKHYSTDRPDSICP